jgi:nucleotide-binding universal stress UspA family protein
MAPLLNHVNLVAHINEERLAGEEAEKKLSCETAIDTLDTIEDVLDTFEVRKITITVIGSRLPHLRESFRSSSTRHLAELCPCSMRIRLE